MNIIEDKTSVESIHMKNGKYIVLDLDATLLHTFDDYLSLSKLVKQDEKSQYLKSRIYNLSLFNPQSNKNNKYYSMWGIYRPFLKEFVEYIIQEFDGIFIWSAAVEKYVETISDLIFSPYDYKPIAIFSKEDCIISDDGMVITKPLEKIFNQFEKVNPENTFVIDDREDTCSRNKDNAIIVPAFEFQDLPKNPSEDDVRNFKNRIYELDSALRELIIFFEKSKKHPDIRSLSKDFIFKIDEKKETCKIIKVCKISPSHNIHR